MHAPASLLLLPPSALPGTFPRKREKERGGEIAPQPAAGYQAAIRTSDASPTSALNASTSCPREW